MEYGIKELSRLAGVSARTLRYYDQLGLLKPSRVNEAGYRYYGAEEVALLQQILFYRQRGFELKTIQKALHDKDFDMLTALEEHLQALEDRKAETEALIATVRKTISHMKGECTMSDKEKFQGLKERMVRENEETYGPEARQKYGNEQVDGANRKMMGLSEEQFTRWQELDKEIRCRLEECIANGVGADSQEAKQIAMLHQQWLSVTLPHYTAPMHKGIAAMYIADERFTAYYDRDWAGCAQLLCDAVQKWI